MNRIADLGPTIVMGKNEGLHTSGHAYRGELEQVLNIVKPQHFLPIYGELLFLKEHELLGKSTGVRHTTVRTKLSGKSGSAYGLVTVLESVDAQSRMQKGRRREEGGNSMTKIVDGPATDELEEDGTSDAEALSSKEADHPWTSSDDETSPSSIHSESRNESSDSGPLPTISEKSTSKSAKQNKWKPVEVRRLIKMRGDLNSRFQVVRGRMVLWEEISSNMLEYGIQRTPAQCKSLWASLIQKCEESNSGKKSIKSWPFYDDMHNILAVDKEAMAAK